MNLRVQILLPMVAALMLVVIPVREAQAQPVSYSNVTLGKRMAARYGWHYGYQWYSLYTLWKHESGWSHRAYNRHSGACGIPQSITSCFGFSPYRQISWGLRYIRGRYRSPAGAYAHWRLTNWY